MKAGCRDQSRMADRRTGGRRRGFGEWQVVVVVGGGERGSQRGGGRGQADFINEEMSDEQRQTVRPLSA